MKLTPEFRGCFYLPSLNFGFCISLFALDFQALMPKKMLRAMTISNIITTIGTATVTAKLVLLAPSLTQKLFVPVK